MFLSSWLRKLRPLDQQTRRTAARPLGRRFRPRLEVLEDRAVPAMLTVTTPLDLVDANDGLFSLREAVLHANASNGTDTIVLPAGTYTLAIVGAGEDGALSGDLDLTGHLTIQGAAAANTVIDAAGLDRVFEILPSATVTLSDLTIQGGNLHFIAGGGGIANGGTLTIRSSVLTGNTALYGGAIYNGDSASVLNPSAAVLDLVGSVVTGNSADNAGAGIYNSGTLTSKDSSLSGNTAMFGSAGAIYSQGTITLRNSSVTNNFAGSGSGIFNAGGVATIVGSTLSNNSSGFNGPLNNGLGGTLTVEASTITDNYAMFGYGGGIANDGPMTVRNSTISNNYAGWGGGGIANFFADATVVGCTISGNSTLGDGGGILNFGTLTVRNSTLSGNSAEMGGGLHNNYGTVMLIDSTISGNSASDSGGGIRNGRLFPGTVTVRNCTIVNNSAPIGRDIYTLGLLYLFDSTIGDIYYA